MDQSISVAIVTYNREQVLIDTIRHILDQAESCSGFGEIIIVDQTKTHALEVQEKLAEWNLNSKIKWIKLDKPNLTGAMNRALLESDADITLFLDDDIIPKPNLLKEHLNAHTNHAGAIIVVGQVLQPGEEPESISYEPKGSPLTRFMDFPFRSVNSRYVENAIACNMSVKTSLAVQAGGFDENFTPPVAARFESEFAKRIVEQGGKIWFEASASIHHLAVKTGGTRSKGSHLSSASPIYGVGTYYFALRRGSGIECIIFFGKKFFREIRTKFHLKNPWYIPVKMLGEIRAIRLSLKLSKQPQKLLDINNPNQNFKI